MNNFNQEHYSDLNEAEKCIEKADYLNAYGEFFEISDQIESAISHLNQHIRDNPDDYRSFAKLGILYHLTGENGKYREWINKALEINPNSLVLWLNKGKAEFFNDEPENAKKIYNTIIEKDPYNIDALNAMAELLFGVSEYSNAIPYYERVLSLDFENFNAINHLGYCFINTNEGSSLLCVGSKQQPSLL